MALHFVEFHDGLSPNLRKALLATTSSHSRANGLKAKDKRLNRDIEMNDEANHLIMVEAIVTDEGNNLDESHSGEACSQACRLHRPMRLASISIIAVLIVIYGLLQLSLQ